MFIHNVKIGILVLFLVTLTMSRLYAEDCPNMANAEFFDGGQKCRCKIGYIENQNRCVEFNLGTAQERALEMRNAERGNNCKAMSRIYKQFARAVGFNSKELATYAGKILSKDGVSFLVLSAPEYAVIFGDSGFKPIYQQPTKNPPPANQVRHFTAYFVAGIFSAKGMLSEPEYAGLLAEWRDKGEQADIDLGNVAAALGRQAAGSLHMMENLDVSIQSQICR